MDTLNYSATLDDRGDDAGGIQIAEILVCHSRILFSESLALALSHALSVRATSVSVQRLATHLSTPKPLVLLDARSSPEKCMSAIRAIKMMGGLVLLLVPSDNKKAVLSFVDHEVDACLSEDVVLSEVLAAIEYIVRGLPYCSPDLGFVWKLELASRGGMTLRTAARESCPLTSREAEILGLIATHRVTNKEIASMLNVSVATVKNHIHSALQKLDCTNRHRAALIAEQQGWLPLMLPQV